MLNFSPSSTGAAVRNDEMGHRDVNHEFVSILDNEVAKKDIFDGKELKTKK